MEKDLKRLQHDIDYCAKQVSHYQEFAEDYSWAAKTLSMLASPMAPKPEPSIVKAFANPKLPDA